MVQPENIVITQGDEAQYFYIIAKGECRCFVRSEKNREEYVRTLYQGMHFGEIALLTGSKRTGSI
jgi:CRP-like cAMP-binding protein